MTATTPEPDEPTLVFAECLICGYETADEFTIECWNDYGGCPNPDHGDGDEQKAHWTLSDGDVVLTVTEAGEHTMHLTTNGVYDYVYDPANKED